MSDESQATMRLAKHRSLPDLRTSQHAAEHEPTIQGKPAPPTVKGVPYLGATKDRTNSDHERGPGVAVATATPPPRQLRPSLKPLPRRRHQPEPLDPQSELISESDCRDPLFDSTALSSRPSSVDRSDSWSSPMTVLKPSRSLKASRRNLVVGLTHNDTKTSSLSIDNDDHDIFTEIMSDNPYDHTSKRFSPLPPKLRTVRRRKRLNLGRPSSNPAGLSVEPIAISLTFSSPAAPQILLPKVSTSALCDRSSYSVEHDSGSRATFDSPSSPNPAEGPTASPERRTSASLSTRPSIASTPLHPSAPATVRLGHPSRPYYSAIRKQGISPPSSRRSSIKSHAVTPTRPSSYSPPSPLPPSKSASPQRHLSLSAVPHSSSFISAFSVDDESDDNADDELPVIPLTPHPVSGRMSFGTSLASVAKSLTRKRSTSGPSALSTFTSKHSHPASSPQAVLPLSAALSAHQGNMKGVFRMSSPSAGSGFSVSGETELKMALALSDAQNNNNTGANTGVSFVSTSTPAIQEEEDVPCISTAPPVSTSSPSSSPTSPASISPQSSLPLATLPNPPRNRIAGLRKLTQGLKDMLLMTTHGAGNNTNSTTTTTT